MTMKISREDWVARYNPDRDAEDNLIDYLPVYQMAPNRRVWTELSDTMGTIVPGRRLADRFAYYITELPWGNEDEHTLEVTDLITKADYAAAIAAANADGNEDLVEILLMQMEDEFGGSDE